MSVLEKRFDNWFDANFPSEHFAFTPGVMKAAIREMAWKGYQGGYREGYNGNDASKLLDKLIKLSEETEPGTLIVDTLEKVTDIADQARALIDEANA